MMLVIKAFHIIAMVCWFAGLFYLPRLFVYHSDATDEISRARFLVMESRLYYAITWPSALLTTGLGIWLILYNPNYYLHATWMHAKLTFVIMVWFYQLYCGHVMALFKKEQNRRSSKFYRIFNEIPSLLLIAIVLLVVVKP